MSFQSCGSIRWDVCIRSIGCRAFVSLERSCPLRRESGMGCFFALRRNYRFFPNLPNKKTPRAWAILLTEYHPGSIHLRRVLLLHSDTRLTPSNIYLLRKLILGNRISPKPKDFTITIAKAIISLKSGKELFRANYLFCILYYCTQDTVKHCLHKNIIIHLACQSSVFKIFGNEDFPPQGEQARKKEALRWWRWRR